MVEKDKKSEVPNPQIGKEGGHEIVESVRHPAGLILEGDRGFFNLPKLQDFLSLYEGRISPSNRVFESPSEKLEFSLSQKELQARVDSILKDALVKFEEAKRDPKKPFTPEKNGKDGTLIPLFSEVVDPSVPLVLKAYKGIYLGENGDLEEMVFMSLIKAVDKTGESIKKAVDDFFGGRELAQLNFKVGNRGIEIYHRYTYQKYQRQGLGNLLLRGAEKFGGARGELLKNPMISEATTGQVDVILWLYKNGYRPTSKKDVERMRMVIEGDPSLAIADEWHVHLKDNSDHRKEHNIPRNSFRFKMSKQIE